MSGFNVNTNMAEISVLLRITDAAFCWMIAPDLQRSIGEEPNCFAAMERGL